MPAVCPPETALARLRRRVDVLKVSAVRVDQSTLVREGAPDPVKDRKRPT